MDALLPEWIHWALAHAAAALPGPRRLPDGHPDAAGVDLYPRVLACRQCGAECDTLCWLCLNGVHGYPCTARHETGACQDDPPADRLTPYGDGGISFEA